VKGFSAEITFIEGPGLEAFRKSAVSEEREFRIVVPKGSIAPVPEGPCMMEVTDGESLGYEIEITSVPVHIDSETEEVYTFRGRIRAK
jgi:hypothetical protein